MDEGLRREGIVERPVKMSVEKDVSAVCVCSPSRVLGSFSRLCDLCSRVKKQTNKKTHKKPDRS